MAILSTGNLLSEQRYDISDARRVESGVRNDFDTTVTAILTNTSQGYIVRGFSIPVAGSIGSAANSLELVVDPGSIMHIAASVSGTIFQTPLGTPNQILNASTNTNVSGSFTANSTNYVGIDYNRFADPTTNVTKYLWNQSAVDEILTIAPAAQTLTFKIYITTSIWAANVLPIAIVTTDPNGNVTSITDARWRFCSLETGGLSPNPSYVYPWSAGRTQPPVTTTSDAVDPFNGGDKQLNSLKEWMNAVMTTFLEIKGTPYWFSGGGTPPTVPTLLSLFQDLGNTVITGSGEISNGILPNSDPILVTTGNIVDTSNQLIGLASVAGIANGDYIFGSGIQAGTTIISIVGTTVTMSLTAIATTTGVSVSFYDPSVITAPGQINWNDPIDIRVVGSELSYIIAANPTSTDITLADDQVAYITLVREVPITPNLVFTTASPVVTSVGAVSWTTGLLAGDFVKLASDFSSGYYEILSVDSTSQVTLTTNVVAADNTGVGGAKAQYAFGSYMAAATPSTNRDIYIANRAAVPMTANTFWLFIREDNGGTPRVYIRSLGQSLDNGESIQIDGGISQQLLKYIGAPTATSSSPQYVSALDPGSIQQVVQITTGAGSTITGSQYFLLYSSNNARQYACWFTVDTVGTQPIVANVNDYIEIDILSTDTDAQVATKIAAALDETPYDDFSAVASGTGITVTNTSAGTCNPAINFNVGSPFAVTVTQTGTGVGNNVIQDGQSLTLAIKVLDKAIGDINALLDSPTYDETIEIVASGATPPTSLTGPIASGTNIVLPNNSREGNVAQYYTVGKGSLMVFLNGQFLDVESGAYAEVGTAGTPSNQIQIQIDLVIGDELEIRLGGGGGGAGGGGEGPPGPPGAQGPRGVDALQGPVAISTKTSSYTVLGTDCFLRANCTSGTIVFSLPQASTVAGNVFYFKKADSSFNAMTILAFGSDTIDGFNSQSTNAQYTSFSLISDGSSWSIF